MLTYLFYSDLNVYCYDVMLYDVIIMRPNDVTKRYGCDQRSYIKIEVQRKKSAIEIFEALQETCGTNAFSYSTVTRWVNKFKSERETVKISTGRQNWKCNHWFQHQISKGIFNTEGENFLSWIVAIDEKLVKSYKPEVKR